MPSITCAERRLGIWTCQLATTRKVRAYRNVWSLDYARRERSTPAGFEQKARGSLVPPVIRIQKTKKRRPRGRLLIFSLRGEDASLWPPGYGILACFGFPKLRNFAFPVVLRALPHSNPANCIRCWRCYAIIAAVPYARSLSTAGRVRIICGGRSGTGTERHSGPRVRRLALLHVGTQCRIRQLNSTCISDDCPHSSTKSQNAERSEFTQ